MNLFLHFWKKRRLGKAFQLFLTVWHQLRNNICMTMLLCDEITLLWITKIWPFWVSDSQNKTTTKRIDLWGFTADAQPKNIHHLSQKLQCRLFAINSGGTKETYYFGPLSTTLSGWKVLSTYTYCTSTLHMYNRLMYRYWYIHTSYVHVYVVESIQNLNIKLDIQTNLFTEKLL